MQQIRYLFRNNFGTYYFRYSLPSWYILRFPKAQKWIYISLMTKDFNLAKLHVQSLSLLTQKTLNRIKNTKFLEPMDKEKNIQSIIRNYRNYIVTAERGGPTLLDRFAAMLSFVMLFNVMPLFSLCQGHGPDFRFSEYRPHREFVH